MAEIVAHASRRARRVARVLFSGPWSHVAMVGRLTSAFPGVRPQDAQWLSSAVIEIYGYDTVGVEEAELARLLDLIEFASEWSAYLEDGEALGLELDDLEREELDAERRAFEVEYGHLPILREGTFRTPSSRIHVPPDLTSRGMIRRPGPPEGWLVPCLPTSGDLARWLGICVDHLDWFADRRRFERKNATTKLRNYRYTVLSKATGGARLIEAPKRRLKAIQRRILSGIVEAIPAHPAACAFERGRSAYEGAAVHTRQDWVAKLDFRDFFPNISNARVVALFRAVGYPRPVARVLGGLCTNSAPAGTLRTGQFSFEQRRMYGHPHLPQGAPTSPAIANRIAWRLDARLSALAATFGARYTRYADDLTFSGPQNSNPGRLIQAASRIASREGFSVRTDKTRIMRRGSQQRVCGLVVNETPAVSRQVRKQLEAILTNCVKHGPSTQNRKGHAHFQAHLRGRIAWVAAANPAQAAKLIARFEAIDWSR